MIARAFGGGIGRMINSLRILLQASTGIPHLPDC